MRIDTKLSSEEREKVQKYARNKGFRLDRAYTELIKKGLEFIMEENQNEG